MQVTDDEEAIDVCGVGTTLPDTRTFIQHEATSHTTKFTRVEEEDFDSVDENCNRNQVNDYDNHSDNRGDEVNNTKDGRNAGPWGD